MYTLQYLVINYHFYRGCLSCSVSRTDCSPNNNQLSRHSHVVLLFNHKLHLSTWSPRVTHLCDATLHYRCQFKIPARRAAFLLTDAEQKEVLIQERKEGAPDVYTDACHCSLSCLSRSCSVFGIQPLHSVRSPHCRPQPSACYPPAGQKAEWLAGSPFTRHLPNSWSFHLVITPACHLCTHCYHTSVSPLHSSLLCLSPFLIQRWDLLLQRIPSEKPAVFTHQPSRNLLHIY